MTFKSLVSPLLSGGILSYIKIFLVASACTFVAFLWFSRTHLQGKLEECQKANIENVAKIAQISQDIQDVRIKQELAIQDRNRIKEETDKLISAAKKQIPPKDCKNLVKWAADNKADTAWKD